MEIKKLRLMYAKGENKIRSALPLKFLIVVSPLVTYKLKSALHIFNE